MKKFTTLEQDIINENAQLEAQFQRELDKIEKNLDEIKIGLKKLAIEFSNEPANWGYFGSVAHINEELEDIMEFMNLNKENQEFVAKNPGAGEY